MIRINGEAVNGLNAKYDGSVLTLKGQGIDTSLTRLSEMLSGEPVIEVVERDIVVGIYRSLQLRALTMEVVGGALAVTVMMAAKPIEGEAGGGGADGSYDLAAQIEEVRVLAQTAVDAVTAIEEGMSHV